MEKKINLGIDATNIRSGGGKTHLIEILDNVDFSKTKFNKVIIWGNKKILKEIKNFSWLVKKHTNIPAHNYFYRFLWHFYILDLESKKNKCDLLFVPGGVYLGFHKKVVTLSQNMLPFDFKEIRRYGISTKSLKLIILHYVYKISFKKSKGIIFLNKYAKNKIQSFCKKIKYKTIIPHGINKNFFNKTRLFKIKNSNKEYKIIYFSSIELYKNHENVIRAVSILKKKINLKISLHLVGPCNDSSLLASLNKEIEKHDPHKKFIKYYGNIKYGKLNKILKKMDIGVFASSCENLPISLIEQMASGLPISCSNKKPMPDILKKNSYYFNPRNVEQIYKSLFALLLSNKSQKKFSKKGIMLARKFNWQITSKLTFKFLETLF